MALLKRRIFFLKFYLISIHVLSIQKSCLSKESFTSDAGWSNRRETWRSEYEMLMEHERQKRDLQAESDASDAYSDLFVIETNDTERVESICGRYGLTPIRKIFEDENLYLFRRSDTRKRFRRRAEEIVIEIGKHSEIQWTSRQGLRDRVRRTLPFDPLQNWEDKLLHSEIENLIDLEPNHLSHGGSVFNDPLFKEQWYLYNLGQTGASPGNDIGVHPVWSSGITGSGVAIAVLDDGVDPSSEEVAANYNTEISEEYLFRKTKLQPVPENSHGTRCAAVAAGVANNSVCGVGVAYGATVGGVRILDGPLTDVQEALALVHALNHVDIYTASWGPTDRGQVVDGPKILARMALIKGVTMGRQGRGAIYVWAAGNGGGYHDNCSLDGYASSPFTLTVGALTEDGRSAFYSEPCAAVIASVYVGGRCHGMPTPEAWKEDKKKIKVVAPEGRGKCEETFQGTSAAAPLAAGVVALILQANPDLTWRDVQHLLIRTSRPPPAGEWGWLTNAAGFRFHPKVGSGVLDARASVSAAKSWKPVDSLRVWTSSPDRKIRQLPPRTETSVPLPVRKSGIDRLETVITTVSIRHRLRGALSMVLVSPSGTLSPILTVRPRDDDASGFERWEFASLHFWGEDPEGVWTLRVRNHDGAAVGFLDYMTITLHGTGTT